MRQPPQLLSNDRSHALIKASGRNPLRLVPEVAMAVQQNRCPRFGCSMAPLHQRQTVCRGSERHGLYVDDSLVGETTQLPWPYAKDVQSRKLSIQQSLPGNPRVPLVINP